MPGNWTYDNGFGTYQIKTLLPLLGRLTNTNEATSKRDNVF
jgi:hypothetical protein